MQDTPLFVLMEGIPPGEDVGKASCVRLREGVRKLFFYRVPHPTAVHAVGPAPQCMPGAYLAAF